MEKKFRILLMVLVFILGGYIATYHEIAQHHSSIGGLALSFAFFLGLTMIYGNMGLSNRKRVLTERRRKILSALNFSCLLIVCGGAGVMMGGLLAFGQTNYIAFAVLLYFLGFRLGTYLSFHV